ncbi:Protein-lysine N-methyltransferase efm6 [Elasticomyces elasticus]|nr:Protein-lysine N-methyltransferase efm6 [Elasticomyces elasticus]
MTASKDEDDGAFAVSEDLVQSPAHKTAGTSTIDFDGLLEPPLKLHEDLSGGCGGQLWPAGMVLTKYMLRNYSTALQRSSILELGAGGGLVGLAVALGCQLDRPVYITDQQPMFELMERNITLNNLQAEVRACIFDWGSSVPADVPQYPDIILAADCVYFEPAFPLLQQTLQDVIGPATVCYFCFKKRRRADLHFMKAVRKNFDVEEIDDLDRATYVRENIFLYAIRRKNPKDRT